MDGDNQATVVLRPRRLLMTADTIGGVWTYAMELAHALQEHGVEIALATMGKPLNAEQRRQARELPNVEVYESNYKLEWMEDPWADVEKAGDWLVELERDLQPDLIHLNDFSHGSLPWKAPHIVVGHSCVLSWWDAVKGGNLPTSWHTYAEKVRAGLRAAGHVIAPTHAMLRQLEHFYGPLGPRKVIYNSRNPALFHARGKEEFIFTAGRLWDEAKNSTSLARIASEIPWPIYVAGEDQHPVCQERKMTRSLAPLGRLQTEELAQWLGRSSIYAAPALYEPFGLSILEAGLSGCALVLGDIPSLRELWNGAATFVSPRDPNALKMELQRLIRNPRVRKEQAALAQCRAIQFNPASMVREYFAVYERTLAHRTLIKERRSRENPHVLSDAHI